MEDLYFNEVVTMEKEVLRYENTICPIDTKFLHADQCTFSVLIRILSMKCNLTITDNKNNFIICHSSSPYPIWIWTHNNIDEKEKEYIYQLTKENFDISKEKFNMKYLLAEYFIKRAKEDNIEIKTVTNLLAYSCQKLITPTREFTGFVEMATINDIDEVTSLLSDFHNDIGIDISSENTYKEHASNYIKDQKFFFWNNGNERVACCSYNEMDNQCSINNVFTKHKHRRCGYASLLVYKISKQIIDLGKTPTLYTDADYSASNSCYTKIGFVPQGTLCTIGSNS